MRDIDRHEAEVFSRFEGSDDFPDIDTDAVREKLENGEADKEADAMLAFAEQAAKENEVEPYKRFSVTETSDAFAPGRILPFGMMSVRSIITMGTERYIPLLTEKKRRNILHRLKRKYRKRKLPSGVMWRLPRRPL